MLRKDWYGNVVKMQFVVVRRSTGVGVRVASILIHTQAAYNNRRSQWYKVSMIKTGTHRTIVPTQLYRKAFFNAIR